MSIPVDLAALGDALARHDTAYLLTAGDSRPHVAEVFPELVDGVVVLAQPGRTASRTVGGQPAVTVMMPPREKGGYTLIVDGDAVLADDGGLHVTPATAVLHRASSWSGKDSHDSACGNDCRPIG